MPSAIQASLQCRGPTRNHATIVQTAVIVRVQTITAKAEMLGILPKNIWPTARAKDAKLSAAQPSAVIHAPAAKDCLLELTGVEVLIL